MSIPVVGPLLGTVAAAPLGILRGIGQIANKPGPNAQAVAQERAEFSRTARVMNAAARAGAAPSPAGLSLEGLRARQAALLAELEAQLGNIFRDAGIAPDQRVDLHANAIGGLGAANDFPRQFALDAILAQRPDLEQSFQQLASVSGLLRAAEAASAAGQPDAQGIATYLDAFAPAPGRLLLAMQDGRASVRYR